MATVATSSLPTVRKPSDTLAGGPWGTLTIIMWAYWRSPAWESLSAPGDASYQAVIKWPSGQLSVIRQGRNSKANLVQILTVVGYWSLSLAGVIVVILSLISGDMWGTLRYISRYGVSYNREVRVHIFMLRQKGSMITQCLNPRILLSYASCQDPREGWQRPEGQPRSQD